MRTCLFSPAVPAHYGNRNGSGSSGKSVCRLCLLSWADSAQRTRIEARSESGSSSNDTRRRIGSPGRRLATRAASPLARTSEAAGAGIRAHECVHSHTRAKTPAALNTHASQACHRGAGPWLSPSHGRSGVRGTPGLYVSDSGSGGVALPGPTRLRPPAATKLSHGRRSRGRQQRLGQGLAARST